MLSQSCLLQMQYYRIINNRRILFCLNSSLRALYMLCTLQIVDVYDIHAFR